MIMNISFEMLGFDFIPLDKIYGFWILQFSSVELEPRSLFLIYYWKGELSFQIFWSKLFKFYFGR